MNDQSPDLNPDQNLKIPGPNPDHSLYKKTTKGNVPITQ